MKYLSILAALFVVAPVLAAPAGPAALLEVERAATVAAPGRYIVKFKRGKDRKGAATKLGLKPKASWVLINGFVSDVDDDALAALRANPDVESISEDGVVSIAATQTNAPWGLGRIDQAAKLSPANAAALNHSYTYDDTAGAGVDVYVIDTGIYTAHSDFGGRASWGISYVSETTDGHGHGTHCAGTIGGTRWGVAKKVNLIAVQVLSASGSGSNSGVISGMNWVVTRAAATGRPTVASMSLGGSANTATDNAVAAMTAAGVHVAVAAGNNNANASGYSPARAPSAVTVGATTVADAKASYSNYGALVDIWAPGSSVTSAWIGGTAATNSISGTSMATPHTAGAIAYLIAKEGNITPAAMATKLQTRSVKSVLTGIPSGTVNYMLQII